MNKEIVENFLKNTLFYTIKHNSFLIEKITNIITNEDIKECIYLIQDLDLEFCNLLNLCLKGKKLQITNNIDMFLVVKTLKILSTNKNIKVNTMLNFDLPPGFGKTFSVSKFNNFFDKIIVACPTALASSLYIDVKNTKTLTVHKLINLLSKNEKILDNTDLLIIDEVSMVSSYLIEDRLYNLCDKFIQKCTKNQKNIDRKFLIFMGDQCQFLPCFGKRFNICFGTCNNKIFNNNVLNVCCTTNIESIELPRFTTSNSLKILILMLRKILLQINHNNNCFKTSKFKIKFDNDIFYMLLNIMEKFNVHENKMSNDFLKQIYINFYKNNVYKKLEKYRENFVKQYTKTIFLNNNIDDYKTLLSDFLYKTTKAHEELLQNPIKYEDIPLVCSYKNSTNLYLLELLGNYISDFYTLNCKLNTNDEEMWTSQLYIFLPYWIKNVECAEIFLKELIQNILPLPGIVGQFYLKFGNLFQCRHNNECFDIINSDMGIMLSRHIYYDCQNFTPKLIKIKTKSKTFNICCFFQNTNDKENSCNNFSFAIEYIDIKNWKIKQVELYQYTKNCTCYNNLFQKINNYNKKNQFYILSFHSFICLTIHNLQGSTLYNNLYVNCSTIFGKYDELKTLYILVSRVTKPKLLNIDFNFIIRFLYYFFNPYKTDCIESFLKSIIPVLEKNNTNSFNKSLLNFVYNEYNNI